MQETLKDFNPIPEATATSTGHSDGLRSEGLGHRLEETIVGFPSSTIGSFLVLDDASLLLNLKRMV